MPTPTTTSLSFVLKMLVREIRASWRRLVFFFVCVAIGVSAIIGVRSIIQSARDVLLRESRTLLAADVLVQSREAWTDETRALVDARLDATPVLERIESVETATMVRPADPAKAVAKMVELRGVEPGFPFYGELELANGATFAPEMLADYGALVRPELLAQLDVVVGDEIVIGDDAYEIRGVVLLEPGHQLSAFSLGSRVLVSHDALVESGLLAFGSRARYQTLVRIDEASIDPLVDQLREDFEETRLRVWSYHSTENRVSRNLRRAENYLSLIGFVIVILGGIGVWSVTRVFIQQKLRSIAILKCLGATTPQLLAVYVLQVVVLGLGGSLLGVAIASVALQAVPTNVVEGYGEITYGLTTSAVVQGAGIGVLVSLLFALVPLLDVRHVRPLLLLRETGARLTTSIDWVRMAAIGLITAALVLVASWQADSWRVGAYVSGGFACVAVVLHFAAAGLVRAVAPLSRATWFPLRHAVISLGRPGNQTRTILLAVGLGSFFLIGVRALQVNLLQEFALEMREDAPDMFLLDIQQDQADGVRELLEAAVPGEAPALLPVLRGRVTGVEADEVDLDGAEDVRERGSLGREYVVTYRDTLEENERYLDGGPWSDDTSVTEVSIEESIRERFDIDVGNTIRFEVLGRTIRARVASVREVQWNDTRRGGFMFVFRPDAFTTAPHSYIAMARGPNEMDARGRLQRDLVARYSNVSIIDVRDVMSAAKEIIDGVTLAISVVGAITVFTGMLILIGSVAMTKFQRLYEAAIFKTLGANSRTIAAMLLLEYGGLGT
ncbi:MAG: ABC transporter permease, partial [Vicinamibacterales bacterium]|nr:ABC transporter permease [Vicinamibacterales bacterium]